jgi:hypothetical protein
MANHARVKTKLEMSPEAVTELLNRLNTQRFKGLLKIEYCDCRGEVGAWGDHVWLLHVRPREPAQGVNYGDRVCWLNSPKSFEIRHGGGGQFLWWVDFAITNEVALVFEGKRSDDSDGVKERGEFGKYDSFTDYIVRNYTRKMSPEYWDFEKAVTPREFRGELKEAIAINMAKGKS